jgi:LmbE family N-acetylglucosaminyl deacetylase
VKNKKILILAPHTDDGELGCGGTISRFLNEGNDVYYVAFSTCVESVPDNFDKNILEIEVKAATKIIGIKEENLIIFRNQVRKLNYIRQDILDEMIKLRNKIKPEIVFLPSTEDVHQDHQTITQEGLRAFKHATILGYELPWNTIGFKAQALFKLTELNIEIKISALKAYQSQRHRDYLDEEFIKGWARLRGTQVGAEYAEAFEVIRWVR